MSIRKNLIFLGSNQNLLIYKEIAEKQNLNIVGIIDSDYYKNTESIAGIPIIGSEEDFFKTHEQKFVYFIGTNWSPHKNHTRDTIKRKKFIDLIDTHNLEIVNLIDSSALISSYAELGKGILIGPNAIIDCNCVIEDYVQIHHNSNIITGSIIGKNTVVQRNTSVEANVGTDTYICMFVKIFPYFSTNKIKIGNNVLIHPEMSVYQHIEDNKIVTNLKTPIGA